MTPGFFRGCLDVGAHRVNVDMYLAAARALADMISEKKISATNIIPRQMDWHISPVMAEAVARAAQETGVAQMGPEKIVPGKDSRAHRKLYLRRRAGLAALGRAGLRHDEYQ